MTAKLEGQRYFVIHCAQPSMRKVSWASKPISTRGTTSRALKVAPMAVIETGVPLKETAYGDRRP